MDLILKNTTIDELKVYIEPSTDEILLKKNDVLGIQKRLEGAAPFEIHYSEGAVVIWIPHGQSADFFINGNEIVTICSQHIW
ncbi:MAG: hypothetical protein HY254_10235 [Burkholderiales bacterium]|nr:hypothetical protein [Burkholderiales bacterium]